MANNHLLEIKDYGQSIWIDYLNRNIFESLQEPDIKLNVDQVMDELLGEGIDKFVQPFDSLMQSLENKIKQLSPV